MTEPVTYQWATASHKGRLRSNNEDSVHPETAGRSAGPVLVMVADGMGGHVAGEIASALAVEHARLTSGAVADRVAAGNMAILEEVDRRPELAGMGTTLTLFELGADRVARFAHVGDSRAYLLRNGDLTQLTADHTVVSEYVREGRIRADEAAEHQQRSMLTRALGLIYDVEIDTGDIPVEPGDRFLLCSDGVSSMIDDSVIHRLLSKGTPEETVWALVEQSNSAGGHDNITALVVDVET